MEALILIIVLVVILLVVRSRIESKSMQSEELSEARLALISAEVNFAQSESERLLAEAMAPHMRTLAVKYKQLSVADDYGRVDFSTWEREAKYFITHFVDKRVIDWHGSVELVEAALSVEVVLSPEWSEVHNSQFFEEAMTGPAFENFVEQIFVENGASVRRTPTTGDQGCDLIVTLDGAEIAVQCKRQSKPVGNAAVQQAVAGKGYYKAHFAWVVTNAGFTPSARQAAGALGVKLVHWHQIEDELQTLLG